MSIPIPIIDGIIGLGSELIKRLIPDPTEQAKAQLELIKLQQSGELAQIMGQLEINKEEAKNPSVFVSGWRPFVGWVCGFGLVYAFIGQPVLAWYSINFHALPPPSLEMGTLITVLGGLLGLSGMRTVEKLNGVDRK